jgi:hypothetical protein
MRRLRLPCPVDLITCNGDTLNYLVTRDDLISTLLHCRENLRPGGYLIGDLLCGHPTDGGLSLIDIRDTAAGRRSLWRIRSDEAHRLTRVEIDFLHPGTTGARWRAREIHVQRWHRPSDLEEAAKQAGLQLVLADPLLVERDRRKPAAWMKIVLRRAPPRRQSARHRTRTHSARRRRPDPEPIRREGALPAEPSRACAIFALLDRHENNARPRDAWQAGP